MKGKSFRLKVQTSVLRQTFLERVWPNRCPTDRNFRGNMVEEKDRKRWIGWGQRGT